MAKIESILGKITGTVGDLTFRHQSGTRSTISAKASKVSNPKSIAQNTQRMKIRPAQLFYNAFQSVLNHSREGVKIGEDHRRAFMSEVLKNSFGGVPYVVKGTSTMVPGLYPMSKGSLISYSATLVRGGSADTANLIQTDIKPQNASDRFPTDATIADASQLILAGNPYLNEGDEICFVAAIADHNGEKFYPLIDYLVLDTTDIRPLSSTVTKFRLAITSLEAGDVDPRLVAYPIRYDSNDILAGGCMIVSRKVGNKWIYTETNMMLTDAYMADLFSAERYQAALASYQEGSANSVNSPFILQQSDNQEYSGRIAMFTATYKTGDTPDAEEVTINYLAAIRANVSNVYLDSARIAVFVKTNSVSLTKELVDNNGNAISGVTPEKIGWTGQVWEWNDKYIYQIV